MNVEAICGSFEGTGTWHDAAGKSMAYTVKQTNRLITDGFEIEFKHDFADGSKTDAHFLMMWITPHLFQVRIGNNVVGNGYCIGNSCNYHIKAGEAFVEVSYRPDGQRLEVNGSSTKNAEGNYIAWHERLGRVTNNK